ncbi:MAG: hypothetical protein R3B40_01965 [Polyangiales bacterium]|nr:hypothetical protein [Myxococcales bacterium]MCB9658791.1 hypothetical protein [Sandaracinaceae bacterium]
MTTADRIDAHLADEAEFTRIATAFELAQDDARRSWGTFVGTFVSNLGLACVPLFRGGGSVLGGIEPAFALACVGPALLFWTASFLYYRTRGPSGTLYRPLREIESLSLDGFILALIFFSETGFSIAWCAQPLTAIFRARLRPNRLQQTLVEATVLHGLLAVGFVGTERYGAAMFTAVAWAGFVVIARWTGLRVMRELRLEAEANVARARTARAVASEGRRRLDETLGATVGANLRQLLEQLDEIEESEGSAALLTHVTQALSDLERAVFGMSGAERPVTREELAGMLREKCFGIMPVGFDVQVDHGPDGRGALVSPAAWLATLRVARELTRNAVVHGGAQRVLATLTFEEGLALDVRDDGSGLSDAAFRGSTGGLDNARFWASMLGGEVLHFPRRPGAGVWTTHLRLWLPPDMDATREAQPSTPSDGPDPRGGPVPQRE